MEDILEELFCLMCVPGGDGKEEKGCLTVIVLLIIVVLLCAAWYYFGEWN